MVGYEVHLYKYTPRRGVISLKYGEADLEIDRLCMEQVKLANSSEAEVFSSSLETGNYFPELATKWATTEIAVLVGFV